MHSKNTIPASRRICAEHKKYPSDVGVKRPVLISNSFLLLYNSVSSPLDRQPVISFQPFCPFRFVFKSALKPVLHVATIDCDPVSEDFASLFGRATEPVVVACARVEPTCKQRASSQHTTKAIFHEMGWKYNHLSRRSWQRGNLRLLEYPGEFFHLRAVTGCKIAGGYDKYWRLHS